MQKEARARIKINKLPDSIKWHFAKTMPDFPHEYIVVEWYPEKAKVIADFIKIVQNNGYEKEFYGKKYRYLEIDGYKYWVMENVINRTKT